MKTEGVTFEELDGQSFLIAKDLGPWDRIVETHLKNQNSLDKSKKTSLKSLVLHLYRALLRTYRLSLGMTQSE